VKVLEVLWDLIDLSFTGIAGVSRRIAFMEKPSPEPSPSAGITEAMWSRVQAGKVYLKALTRLVMSCAVFPIPILIIGILGSLGWLVAIVGIFWTLWSFLLLALATPIGMLLEFILGGFKGIADRYVKFSLGVFLVELLFTLFISVVPIQNNPSAIPIVIIASAILGIIAARGVQTPFSQKFISVIVTLIFIVFTLSFFFPKSFESVKRWGKGLDLTISGEVENASSDSTGTLLPQRTMPKTENRNPSKPDTIKRFDMSTEDGKRQYDFALAVQFYKEGSRKRALAAFEDLVAHYPNSPEGKRSNEMLSDPPIGRKEMQRPPFQFNGSRGAGPGMWQTSKGLIIELLYADIMKDSLRLVMSMRAVEGSDMVLYAPKLHEEQYGDTFEPPYILDDNGAKYSSISGFLGGRQEKKWGDYLNRIEFNANEEEIISATFPMMSRGASTIKLVSPRIDGWQTEWWIGDIKIKNVSFSLDSVLIQLRK